MIQKLHRKGISLDGLTSITKEVARELAKCTGDLNLNSCQVNG